MKTVENPLAMKQPRLRVQARHVGLVGDFDLGADLEKVLDRTSFGGAGVRGGDDA
jgi:hypothetical protein